MEFLMLGPFEARHNGSPVDLGDLQQRYALVVLLLHVNKPVNAERLIEIMWGQHRPKTNLVTGYIAKIRKLFRELGVDDVIIDRTPTGYVLKIDEERLDTFRFERLCAESGEAIRGGDRTRAIGLLHAAVGLWRGRFLEDLDIDRIGGSDVISPDDAFVDAVGDLAELELAAGNHRWVRDRLRPLVHANPGRQRHAILLMRALLANGDQVEAMKIYHQTRDALDEYGMPTSTELRNLAWLAHNSEPRGTLPARPPRFTGRVEELKSIETVARNTTTEPGAVWVSGMQGVGKTALAVEAAHLLRDQFSDGQLFISLNGFTPNAAPVAAVDAAAQLLVNLGVPDEQVPPTLTRRLSLYQSKLRGTRTLVVLDNAASEDQVLPVLPQAAGCLAIVTSRNVGGLETNENIRLAPLSPVDAGTLFRNLTGDDRLHGRSAQVAEVVARCGRLPLQIKVVAAQFRRHNRWPLDHLVQLLDELGPSGGDARFDEASMVSYRQLDEPARTLFRLFGQFPGQDLSVPGVAALAGCDLPAATRLLDELYEMSLLEEAVPGRYHMLDPLKEFAAAIPAPSHPTESPEGLERLLNFYLVAVFSAIKTAFPFERLPVVDRECSTAPVFEDKAAALAWLSIERLNLVSVIRYASERHPGQAWQLTLLLWRYFNTTGNLENWIETLELARKIVMAEPANEYGQAHVLLQLSTAHWRLGRLAHALELATAALPMWERLGDGRGEADALCAIAMPTMELGDHDRAVSYFEAALAKYAEIGDKRGQANALSMLGHLNELHGHLDVAQRQHLAAVPMLREIGHLQGLAHALDNLGSVQQRLGLLDEAMASHEEARSVARDMGDRAVEAYALNNIGNVHRLRDDLTEALRYQEEAKTVANAVADAYLRTQLYLDRGATFHALGDLRDALRAFLAALDLAGGTGDRTQQAHANLGIAQVLHATGEHERAVEHWRAAEVGFTELRTPEAGEIRRERETLDCACR